MDTPFQSRLVTLDASAPREGLPRKPRIPTQIPTSQRPPGSPAQTGPPVGGQSLQPSMEAEPPKTPGRLVAVILGGCLEEAVERTAWAVLPQSPPSTRRFPWTDLPAPS